MPGSFASRAVNASKADQRPSCPPPYAPGKGSVGIGGQEEHREKRCISKAWTSMEYAWNRKFGYLGEFLPDAVSHVSLIRILCSHRTACHCQWTRRSEGRFRSTPPLSRLPAADDSLPVDPVRPHPPLPRCPPPMPHSPQSHALAFPVTVCKAAVCVA